jgi:hypothetical protein
VDEAAEIKLEYRTTGSKQFAKIHLGDYSIRGGIDGGIQGFVFTTPSSIRHFVFQNGTLRGVNGSAAAPAYSFADNYNTGMFRQSANTLAFSTGGQERLRINSIGNVGIDTNNPTEKLQVEGFTRTSSGYKVSTETVIDANRNYTGKNGSFSGVLSVTGPGNSFFSGNVGIGTSTPGSYKLAVAGNIRATEVQIEHIDQWYDCVFEDNYHLASLKNLEDFIKDNKHLPEIPSGKEVIEKGINVGEMNALLLKKIEELTLYLIGQHKEIEKQKSELIEQQKQIEELKNELR